MYVPLPRFLLRAPLLPAAALTRGARALLRHPLGRMAVELASPSLAAAAVGPRRDRALDRYARRAAFRPTPHGLFAGVCMGTLAARTAIASGTPDAWLTPSWARIDELARLLLDDPELRERTRLRVAPSAMRGASVIRWIGPGDPFDELHEAELDHRLAAIVSVAERWTSWPEVRAAATAQDGDDDDDSASGDELLLTLLDDGLLASDLAPPIIGRAPAAHLAARLAALGETDAARAVDDAAAALATGDVARGRATLATLPGGHTAADADADLHAVLIHRPAAPPTLERAAVERAARLAPLLVRLQEALAAPAAERFAQPTLADGLDAVTELYGAGAFDVAALATGDYGIDVRDDDDHDGNDNDGHLPARPPHTAVLAVILDAIAAAGTRGDGQASLDPDALTIAIADLPGPPLPCSAELFLAPIPRRRGAAPGTGWLLGLHAPAGASFGRFVHPLGGEAVAAIAELEAAERHARPEEMPLDVAFSPSPDLADLAARPASARRRLALTRWGDVDSDGAADELCPAGLELVADPSDPAALALRARDGGVPVVPASFARLRSTTAPAGVPRLLVGWSLWRQHAPWALPVGPLAELAFIPRLCLDGFVIAPASWRLPEAARSPEAIRRWRRTAGVPRYVQVGQGDELLPVDLAGAGAAADLGSHRRVYEIWPPLDASTMCDRDGRRLEAVVMLIEQPDDADAPACLRRSAAVRAAGTIPPPHRAPAHTDWTTYKLFGPAARQDDLLTLLIPIVRAGQHADEIDRWFFQRYIDGPGRRHHVRLRVHARADADAFARRLRNRLRDARAAAVLTGITVDEYHPEHGRFRADELDAVFALFEADSELAVSLNGAHAIDPVVLFVRACDALAVGLGMDLDARHALAKQRRHAAEVSADLFDEDRARADEAFRAAGRVLRAALQADIGGDAGGDTDPHAAALAAHRARVAHAARDISRDARARLLPTLLHLSAVRCLGPHPDRERLAYTFWERTLAGLRRPARGRAS